MTPAARVEKYRIVGDSENREAGGELCEDGLWELAGEIAAQRQTDPFSDDFVVRTSAEERHRNDLAARLGVPVPGMSGWLEAPLREARRLRYREAALAGLSSIGDTEVMERAPRLSKAMAKAMLDQETDHE